MRRTSSMRIIVTALAAITLALSGVLAAAQVRDDLDLRRALDRPDRSGVLTSKPESPAGPVTPTSPAHGSEEADVPSPSATAPTLVDLVDSIPVIPARPSPPGYDRDCSPGDGCVFGPAWTDDNSTPLGHNGCDTRNDILARDLDDPQFKEGTRDCVVMSGTFVEPYTGRTIHFVRGGNDVQIDHIVPLALAWDLGAFRWPQDRRVDFANDPRNLLAADGPANQSKSDQGPGSWLPINPSFRCDYVALFTEVLLAYGLPLPAEDLAAMRVTAEGCPT